MNLVVKVEFIKISISQEKAQCVSWFTGKVRCKYGRKPPVRPTIQAWHKKFKDIGSVLQRKGAGQSQISEEIESVKVHILEPLESPFVGLLHTYRSHASLFTKLCIETYNFMLIKCSYCKPLSQKDNP